MGAVTSDFLVENYSELLLELSAEGYGRRRSAAHISALLEKEVSPGVVRVALDKLGVRKESVKAAPVDMTVEDELTEEEPIEDLVALRVKKSRKRRTKQNRHRKTVRLENKPIGIMIFGDPHVDNEGCDWGTLFDHIKLAQQTEGVLAACVGDMQDNWVGRLAKLYSKTSVKAEDGWRLSEWFLEQLQWIAIVGGNHDAWAHGPGVDPMAWLSQKCGVKCYAPDELRVTIKWDDDELDPIVWVLRHDFSGRSWYHPTHGPHKEAMLDGRCHLLTAGHLHQWGILTTEQRHARVTHALRVRGYKRNDAYAREKGFFEQTYGESALIVINPFAEGPGRISVFWDLEVGCEYLTWLRSQDLGE